MLNVCLAGTLLVGLNYVKELDITTTVTVTTTNSDKPHISTLSPPPKTLKELLKHPRKKELLEATLFK